MDILVGNKKYDVEVAENEEERMKGLQEVIEIFYDMTIDEIKDYTLVLGSNILKEAFWSGRGEAYGDTVDVEHVLLAVDEVLQKQGLSIEDLKCKIEV